MPRNTLITIQNLLLKHTFADSFLKLHIIVHSFVVLSSECTNCQNWTSELPHTDVLYTFSPKQLNPQNNIWSKFDLTQNQLIHGINSCRKQNIRSREAPGHHLDAPWPLWNACSVSAKASDLFCVFICVTISFPYIPTIIHSIQAVGKSHDYTQTVLCQRKICISLINSHCQEYT